ncbi:type II secretion system protein GspL [Pararobbsia silviterrae]|uniref:Type II secretion system protein GspL n=1 Tax=Pararobbsia silviterrae TaxID=1792498 RepID=A0A494YEL9_9BURK|nr:type II secretion system protein GspL [Pararobbsia silviterrae]RKP58517.1 type II secretion system protein GspL [Pararobbsia silviterrae]
MTTLIVQLPPRDPAAPAQEWSLPALPFVLLDKRGRTMRSGSAGMALLPKAALTVALVAARDTLLLRAKVPPVKGLKLRQILPNVVEDQIIQDPQTCHIAVDPEPAVNGVKLLAVIDRGWMRFLTEAFSTAGHRNVRMVPLTAGLPASDDSAFVGVPSATGIETDEDALEPVLDAATVAAAVTVDGTRSAVSQARADEAADRVAREQRVPVVAAMLGTVVTTDPLLAGDATFTPALAEVPRIELAIARGRLGEGMAVPANALDATLNAVAAGAPLTVYRLSAIPGAEPGIDSGASHWPDAHGASQPISARAIALPFESVARAALASRFDLCQFEFASQGWRPGRRTWRLWRLPALLALASVLVTVVGLNIQWFTLSRERDALVSQQTETLLSAFPRTSVVLEPASQMARQLDQLRLAAGQLSPSDFLSLSAGLSRSLGNVPSDGIASIAYRERTLTVTFKPTVHVDPGFESRLAGNGLAGQQANGKWTIKSASAGNAK